MRAMPEIIVNCKAYERGVGRHAFELAKTAVSVGKKFRVSIALAVQPQDISAVASTGVCVFAQHIDPITRGAFTGSVLAEGVKSAGALGTLLNHSERRLPLEVLGASISAARRAGLFVCCCAATPSDAKRIALLNPDVIAIEPPGLIGGKIAVSQARPEVITATTRIVSIPVFCGAGIQSGDDVKKALELGAKGILVSSAVVNAARPAKILENLASAFKEFR